MRVTLLWQLRLLLYDRVLALHWWAQFPDWDYDRYGCSGSGSRPIYP